MFSVGHGNSTSLGFVTAERSGEGNLNKPVPIGNGRGTDRTQKLERTHAQNRERYR